MRTKLGLLSAVVAMFVGCNKVGPDSAAMQGTWDVVELYKHGEQEEKERLDGDTVRFAGDKMTIVRKGDHDAQPVVFKLDEAKKYFDMIDEKAGTHLGLYELKGDELKVCLNADPKSTERPTRLQSDPDGPNDSLLVLRRAKK